LTHTNLRGKVYLGMTSIQLVRGLSFAVTLSILLCAGCGKPASTSKEPVVVAETNEVDGSDETEIELTKKLEAKRRAGATKAAPKSVKAAAPVVAQPRTPRPGEQSCFQCNAQGQVVCVASGCRKGYLPCPAA
jgi:hypothetical protein